MINTPSGCDWYDGSKMDNQKIVKARLPRSSQRRRHIGGRRVRDMKKTDQSRACDIQEKVRRTQDHGRIHGPLFYGVAGQRLPDQPACNSDLQVRLTAWYNHERPHVWLDADIKETTVFERRMIPPGSDIPDE